MTTKIGQIVQQFYNKTPFSDYDLERFANKEDLILSAYPFAKEFGKLSYIPVLINISFNIRGEPVVCTPFDAYKCMMGTGIDYLILDRFLI